MKATELLHRDHETVDRALEQIRTGNTGSKTRGEVVAEVVRDLSVHAAIEEQILYPIVREFMPDHETEILEDLEEHHVMKILIKELADMRTDDDRFIAKVIVLSEIIEHHVDEEESELFPAMEQRFDEDELEDLGASLEKAKSMAPTRPHPHGPDEPPANLANVAVGLLDRFRDRVHT
jgi:hemerythrin superfamily protein